MFLTSGPGDVVSRWGHGDGGFAHDNFSPHLGRALMSGCVLVAIIYKKGKRGESFHGRRVCHNDPITV